MMRENMRLPNDESLEIFGLEYDPLHGVELMDKVAERLFQLTATKDIEVSSGVINDGILHCLFRDDLSDVQRDRLIRAITDADIAAETLLRHNLTQTQTSRLKNLINQQIDDWLSMETVPESALIEMLSILPLDLEQRERLVQKICKSNIAGSALCIVSDWTTDQVNRLVFAVRDPDQAWDVIALCAEALLPDHLNHLTKVVENG